MERVAKPDYAAVHLALARWRLEHPGEDLPADEPIVLFDDQALGQAVERHPAGGSDAA